MMILVFIVVIIGGLGSVEGAFIGALLVGLLAELHCLSRTQAGADFQHCPDDGHPDVAAAGHDARCEREVRC
jgi:ABC-type branched-subunit amino acid transport system permease subunit